MVQDFFAARNQEQLLCYSQFLKVWDVIFAMIYTLMYGSWVLYLLIKKIYLVVPILGMIADWSENFSELLMIQSYVTSGSITQSLVSVGSGINSFKWIMSSLTYLLVIIGIIVAIRSFLIKKSN
jgi:glucose-6-phosphate-specific signal transduction histidine kinase